MAKNCNQNQRIINNDTVNNKGTCCGATDVCLNPQCGEPRLLNLLAPVIYDEVGINVCRTITLPEGFLADYPTTYFATAEVIDISLETTAAETSSVTPIATRPNCYNVTLTNLTVDFVIKLYDYSKRLLATLSLPGIVYLPSDVTAEGYDAETNPASTSFDIFAPYGISYVDGDITTPELNVIGFSDTNNTVAQGLNIMALPKVLDFDPASDDITIGLTIICNSVYFNAYRIPHDGKAVATKESLVNDDDSIRMEFVEGSLLDRNIKPLELCNPGDQKNPNLNDEINNCGGSN